MDMRLIKKVKIINCITFFTVWVVFLFSQTVKPLHPGFYWMVSLVTLLDILLYMYMDEFIIKMVNKRRGLFLTNLIYFTLGGFSVTNLTTIILVNIGPELELSDFIIWAFAGTVVGLINGICFYFFNKIILKKYKLF